MFAHSRIYTLSLDADPSILDCQVEYDAIAHRKRWSMRFEMNERMDEGVSHRDRGKKGENDENHECHDSQAHSFHGLQESLLSVEVYTLVCCCQLRSCKSEFEKNGRIERHERMVRLFTVTNLNILKRKLS